MRLLKWPVWIAAAATLSTALSAQAPNTPNKLLLGLGLGQGSGWPTCADCAGISHRQGLTGYVRAGAFVTPRVGLSLEGDRWYNNSSDADSWFQSAMAVLQLYAAPTGGLSLKLGAGVGNSVVQFDDPSFGELSSVGFAYTAGLGYDFPITPRLAATVFGDYLATAGAAERYTLGGASGSFDGNVLRFGVGITWR
jgi:hypothetical protein